MHDTDCLKKSRKSAAAVICELNPPHFGHISLFKRIKESADYLVAVMSGNFVQRGDAAIIDKWERTRLALEDGADLVIELPLPWSTAGAERFAAGGVALVNALGCVDCLSFGSELADSDALHGIAAALLSPEFKAELSCLPDSGEAFAVRRERALARLIGEEKAALLRMPNALLGVEYCKALIKSGSGIAPAAFKRIGAGHDGKAADGFLSSSEIRSRFFNGGELSGFVPENTLEVLNRHKAAGKTANGLKELERAVLYRLRTMEPGDFLNLPDISEGLENRMYSAARTAASLEEFYALVKSKRYALSRIRRLTLHAFLGVAKDLPELPPYIRVLGMNKNGEGLLGDVRLPILNRSGDFEKQGGEALSLFKLEAKADDIYALACPSPSPCGRDCSERLIKL